MSDIKATAVAFLTALGQGDAERLGQLISPDICAICTGTSALSGARNYSDIYNTVGLLKTATRSGIEFRILTLTAEGDRVAVEAEGFSTLANGVPYNNQYHFLFFVRAGKVYKLKEYMDTKLVDAVLAPLVAAAAA